MALPAGYKPSPLGYGSPRTSPFRRQESPLSSSSPSAHRQTTPTPSPTKANSLATPSRFASVSSPTSSSTTTTPTEETTPRRHVPADDDNMPFSQTLGAPAPISSRTKPSPSVPHGNALSQLQPAQVRVLRDGFQILDRDSDGVVNREDVADMLNQLGLPASASDISQFFPAGGPQSQSLTLAAFLQTIASSLAAMSPAGELESAFAAFDDDDSGQVDVGELRDALLHTTPESGSDQGPPLAPAEVDRIIAAFSGRRAFSKSMMAGARSGGGGGSGGGRRGEVFRYHDFVSSVVGGGAGAASEPGEGAAEEG